MDSEDLVSICSVQNPTEAELIRSALESAGIACEIGGESQAGLAGVLAIDVLTHASDAEQARMFLASLRRENEAAAEEAESSTAIQESPPPM